MLAFNLKALWEFTTSALSIEGFGCGCVTKSAAKLCAWMFVIFLMNSFMYFYFVFLFLRLEMAGIAQFNRTALFNILLNFKNKLRYMKTSVLCKTSVIICDPGMSMGGGKLVTCGMKDDSHAKKNEKW